MATVFDSQSPCRLDGRLSCGQFFIIRRNGASLGGQPAKSNEHPKENSRHLSSPGFAVLTSDTFPSSQSRELVLIAVHQSVGLATAGFYSARIPFFEAGEMHTAGSKWPMAVHLFIFSFPFRTKPIEIGFSSVKAGVDVQPVHVQTSCSDPFRSDGWKTL